MGRRIILFLILPCLILALFLSMAGFTQVGIGDSFYNYMQYVSLTLNKWNFEIPNIPNIPLINNIGVNVVEKSVYRVTDIVSVTTTPTAGTAISQLTGLLNFFIKWVNFQINFVNVLIKLLNILVSLIQYLFTFLYCLKDITKVVSVSNNWDGVSQELFWYASIGS